MSLGDDKKNVFTKIGAFVSLSEDLKKNAVDVAGVATEYSSVGSEINKTNLFPSINNKDDIVPFLLDMLKVVVGSTALQELTGQLLTDFLDNTEDGLKSIINEQLIDFDSTLPISGTSFSDGMVVNLKDIDVFEKIKSSPSSDIGDLLYDDQITFDKILYDSVNNAGNPQTYENLSITFNSVPETLTIKPIDKSISVGQWISGFVGGLIIINKKEFIARVINNIYGTLSSTTNKSFDQIIKEEEVKKIIEQITEGDDNFELSESKKQKISEKSQELMDGIVRYDMGCGILNTELPFNEFESLIQTVSGLTDSVLMGEQIGNVIQNSTKSSETVSDRNENTIKDGFFQQLILSIKTELSIALTATPQIRTLLAIKNLIINGSVEIGDPTIDLKNFKVYIKCIIKKMLKLLHEFIVNMIIGLLMALLFPIIKEVVKEQINQYIGIIKSLISDKI